MKRMCCLLLCLVLLVSLFGCASSNRFDPIRLYYKTADVSHSSGLIGYELSEEPLTHTADGLAARYFSGPQDEALRSPFPKGTSFISAAWDGSILYMTVSDHMAELSGVNLSVAISCISLTFSQLNGVEDICISAENELLNGQESITIHSGSILLQDNSLDIAESKLTLYYSDSKSRYLIPVTVGTKLETVSEQALYALQKLGEEPEEDDLRKTMPKNTEILDLSIDSGLCIVDFSTDFFRYRPQSDALERMTILSIVNTLTQFEEIKEVQFYVEGENIPLYTSMDLSLRYVRDESAIGPVRSGLNEVDASIYVLRSGDGELAQIPIRMKSAANETDADALLSELLNFTEQNGYTSAIPDHTAVNSLHMEGYHCYVDLNQAFADNLKTETDEIMAVYSLVSTLTSLESIRWVTITVNGSSNALKYVDLNQNFR